MKKTFLLLLQVAMLLQSCEEGASPYKDADKVGGSIKEISFAREVPPLPRHRAAVKPLLLIFKGFKLRL